MNLKNIFLNVLGNYKLRNRGLGFYLRPLFLKNNIMKKLFFIICILIMALIVILNISCSSSYRCTPSKKSRDYAVRQFMKQRSDGYWVVTTDSKFLGMKKTVFECKPDSVELEKLKSI